MRKQGNSRSGRDDFPKEVLRVLADRAGHRCSKPGCRMPTTGPQVDATKSLNLGVGAHITAAAPGGPRYDASLSSEERKGIANALWLCQNCAKLIDNDAVRFPVELLRGWKQDVENETLAQVGKTPLPPSSDTQVQSVGVAASKRLAEEDGGRLAAVFVPPAQYEKARQVLLSQRLVMIAGPPHIGKTATALSLAREVQRAQGLEGVVRLGADDDLQMWMGASNQVLVLDDCFGETSLSRRDLAGTFSGVTGQLSERNYVICTTRTPILQEAQENTRLGEDSALNRWSVALEQEGSYDDEALWRILQSHVNWVRSERADERERIRPEQAELALRCAGEILSRLRFPHNIERLCRAHLGDVADYEGLKQAIESAREIEKAVERWAEALEESDRWFVFVTALFGGVRTPVLERIYTHVAHVLGFRAQDADRLLDRHSAYLFNRSRPQLRHPSYTEALLSLLRRRYKRSVGRVVDRGMFLVLQGDVNAFARCWQADYGWPRPADFDVYGEEARAVRDAALADPNSRPFPLNPYLEQLAEAYALLRNGLFQGFKPILEPCHCPNNGTFAVLLPPVSNEFGLLMVPSLSDAPPYAVERVDDLRQRINQILDEAIEAHVPLRAERLYPHDVGQRSPQMHALLLIRRQLEHIFQKQRLPEAGPMIHLRMEQVLREFNLQDCVGTPHEWRFRIDWHRPFGENDLKRVTEHFERLEAAQDSSYLHPEVWERMKGGYARSLLRLHRAYELLEEFGTSYNGPLIPQFDRTEQEFGGGPRFSYTPGGMHRAVHRSLEAIIESYKWMVEFAFGPLREQMPCYRHLPFKIVGAVNLARDTNHWMLTRTLIYILPADFQTQDGQSIELHVREVEERDTTTLEAHGREHFPVETQERLKAAESHGLLRVLSPPPGHFRSPDRMIALVYEWLHEELDAAMGWRELGDKRSGFLRTWAQSGHPNERNIMWDMTNYVDPWEFEDWKQS